MEPVIMPPVKTDISEFQKEVYRAVKRIPRGRVTTYGLLAAHIGCRSARAVGQALMRNPFAPDVPCHRVISSDLTIGGFQGKTAGMAVRRKRALLKKEGICFHNGIIDDSDRIFRY